MMLMRDNKDDRVIQGNHAAALLRRVHPDETLCRVTGGPAILSILNDFLDTVATTIMAKKMAVLSSALRSGTDATQPSTSISVQVIIEVEDVREAFEELLPKISYRARPNMEDSKSNLKYLAELTFEWDSFEKEVRRLASAAEYLRACASEVGVEKGVLLLEDLLYCYHALKEKMLLIIPELHSFEYTCCRNPETGLSELLDQVYEEKILMAKEILYDRGGFAKSFFPMKAVYPDLRQHALKEGQKVVDTFNETKERKEKLKSEDEPRDVWISRASSIEACMPIEAFRKQWIPNCYKTYVLLFLLFDSFLCYF